METRSLKILSGVPDFCRDRPRGRILFQDAGRTLVQIVPGDGAELYCKMELKRYDDVENAIANFKALLEHYEPLIYRFPRLTRATRARAYDGEKAPYIADHLRTWLLLEEWRFCREWSTTEKHGSVAIEGGQTWTPPTVSIYGMEDDDDALSVLVPAFRSAANTEPSMSL